MPMMENKTFDEIRVGDCAALTRTLHENDIRLFAAASGDVNPAHLDPSYANTTRFRGVIGHGMWSGALISALLGTELPGPGTIYVNQQLNFVRPVRIGDTINVRVTVREKNAANGHIIFDCLCTKQPGEVVTTGTAEVVAPQEKVRGEFVGSPQTADRYERLLQSAKALPRIRLAIVHPCSSEALVAALEAQAEGLIEPVLVGPRTRIAALAAEAKLSITGIEQVDTEHSHASAATAVALARAGKVNALMKGSLHTDELLHAVLDRESGLRTARRLSHAFVMDVPNYPRPLILTDAAINIYPNLLEKRDIVQNAIDLAQRLGVHQPRVAILSAVETVDPKIASTVDAAALCKMAERGQLHGGVLDGPLAFDNAINLTAARIKGIHSEVAGQADILIVPDLEAGNLLYKQLVFLTDIVA